MSDTTTTQAIDQLQTLLQKMEVEAEGTATSDDPPMLEVKSKDAASLIGHRGEGMKALQHVLRLILVRQGVDLPVLIDIEGYRARQHEQLQQLAQRKAEEVKETGRLAVLQPMSSYERRLVHMALADHEEVVTESLGEGTNRRVMIKKKE